MRVGWLKTCMCGVRQKQVRVRATTHPVRGHLGLWCSTHTQAATVASVWSWARSKQGQWLFLFSSWHGLSRTGVARLDSRPRAKGPKILGDVCWGKRTACHDSTRFLQCPGDWLVLDCFISEPLSRSRPSASFEKKVTDGPFTQKGSSN